MPGEVCKSFPVIRGLRMNIAPDVLGYIDVLRYIEAKVQVGMKGCMKGLLQLYNVQVYYSKQKVMLFW